METTKLVCAKCRKLCDHLTSKNAVKGAAVCIECSQKAEDAKN